MKKSDVFTSLFTQYHSELYYYALGILGNTDWALDCVNDAFEKLWRAMGHVDTDKPLKPLLYNIVKNCCIDYLRKNRVSQDYIATIDFKDGVDSSLIIDETELFKQINDTIESLAPKTRQVFELCYMAGKKYSEVAEELSISVNTVKTHISRALSILRAKHSNFFILFLLFFVTHF